MSKQMVHCTLNSYKITRLKRVKKLHPFHDSASKNKLGYYGCLEGK
jgi:hypothetical protein